MIKDAYKKDKRIADTRLRLGEKGNGFQTYYLRDDEVMMTVRSKPDIIDMSKIEYVSWQSIRNAQTFPRDYDFGSNSVSNICYVLGMSVPPIMMKRVVERLIESKIFEDER